MNHAHIVSSTVGYIVGDLYTVNGIDTGRSYTYTT
jgi:hypothetical protein